jgi:hypothetical protein
MDFAIWLGVGAATALLIPVALYFLPAKTQIFVDTPTSTARAEMRLLWGFGPSVIARALPKQGNGNPLTLFSDGVRIGHALMTPGIADAAFSAIRSLYDLKARVAQVTLGVNLADPSKNLVVQTAAQAAIAAAPAALRERVTIRKSDGVGAELSGQFDLDASPAQLNAIYTRFRTSRAAREFRRRLKRKLKADKKGPSEVRVS